MLSEGFEDTSAKHQIKYLYGKPIDIVPFGQIADQDAHIAWPPGDNPVMNVLGFQEVCDHAEMVRLQNHPPVDIPVATPAGMAVLKLIAWTDRSTNNRNKDAKDLLYLFTTYEKIPAINHALYENEDLMEAYDWDLELAGAYQLGVDATSIANDQTNRAIATLFNGNHDSLSVDDLIDEMGTQGPFNQAERHEALINAFMDGFFQRIRFQS